MGDRRRSPTKNCYVHATWDNDVTDFSYAIKLLETARHKPVADMRREDDSSDTVSKKRSVDNAIATLKICQSHGINGRVRVTQLPMPETCTPSFHYRIVADNEASTSAEWTELLVDGVPLCPLPYALLVEGQECSHEG